MEWLVAGAALYFLIKKQQIQDAIDNVPALAADQDGMARTGDAIQTVTQGFRQPIPGDTSYYSTRPRAIAAKFFSGGAPRLKTWHWTDNVTFPQESRWTGPVEVLDPGVYDKVDAFVEEQEGFETYAIAQQVGGFREDILQGLRSSHLMRDKWGEIDVFPAEPTARGGKVYRTTGAFI